MTPRVKTLFTLVMVIAALLLVARLSHAQPVPSRQVQAANAKRLLAWVATQKGVRELTGNNDGPQVEGYQRTTGNHKGEPWCGSYQATANKVCKLPFPAGAGAARNWKVPKRTYYEQGRFGSPDSVKPADRLMFYYRNLGRIGHIAMAVAPARSVRRGRPSRGWYTNEGNTGSGGGREGAGVHVLYRANTDFYAASNWSY
jgi:hypothetical protein